MMNRDQRKRLAWVLAASMLVLGVSSTAMAQPIGGMSSPESVKSSDLPALKAAKSILELTPKTGGKKDASFQVVKGQCAVQQRMDRKGKSKGTFLTMVVRSSSEDAADVLTDWQGSKKGKKKTKAEILAGAKGKKSKVKTGELTLTMLPKLSGTPVSKMKDAMLKEYRNIGKDGDVQYFSLVVVYHAQPSGDFGRILGECLSH